MSAYDNIEITVFFFFLRDKAALSIRAYFGISKYDFCLYLATQNEVAKRLPSSDLDFSAFPYSILKYLVRSKIKKDEQNPISSKIVENHWRPRTRQTATEFIQIFQDPQLRKSNFCMSLFDIPKYAQMKKVLVCQNMLRSDHMDKYGIGTDCSVDTLNMFLSSSNLPSWP